MANFVSPVPCLIRRELGLLKDFKNFYFDKRLKTAKSLYRRDFVCHYGCVNAIEFSSNGEFLVSGGDDRRVMVWNFGEAIVNRGKPENMIGLHQSNIFCLGITSDNERIYSGGNDDTVIVHDLESKRPLETLQHQRPVSGLSINPYNEKILVTAGNDGRLLLFDTRQSDHETLVISRSRKVFHAVMYHPIQTDVIVSGNARDGVALWDLRSPKHPVVRYLGSNGASQNSMSVRFNQTGNLIVALRRRQSPVLYHIDNPEPITEFYHQDYYNSCTMKSCCFAGEGDRYIVSGSDDFNLYVWKVPDVRVPEPGVPVENVLEPSHLVLYGHRSIVNQARYNPHYCLLASSGVEKIIKIWSAIHYPEMRGNISTEELGSDNPREIYSHEDYVSLVHHSGMFISHNYSDQSTSEDPRMMAFFDSLVQRELECVAEETITDEDSNSASPTSESDTTDSDDLYLDFFPLPLKRPASGPRRSSRLARLVASRYSKNLRSQKRGCLRRSKQTRTTPKCNGKGVASVKGKRTLSRNSRITRRSAARTPHTMISTSRISAPSSERTDSDEPAHCLYRNSAKILKPLRRRMNLTRTAKRKIKGPAFRKRISNGSRIVNNNNNHGTNFSNLDHVEENLSLPSTSTGYRGQSSSVLFRIAEVDSDDDQSVGSPVPRTSNGANEIPPNLISIIPTPINGLRDNLGESLRVGPLATDHRSPPAIDTRLRSNLRRLRRSGRPSLHLSDSSESPSPKESTRQPMTLIDRLSPKVGHSRTVARLMNETNESEMESSCSTEGSFGPRRSADSGPSTSRLPLRPVENASDDQDFPAYKFRQRVKKSRHNYRNHNVDSDSN